MLRRKEDAGLLSLGFLAFPSDSQWGEFASQIAIYLPAFEKKLLELPSDLGLV